MCGLKSFRYRVGIKTQTELAKMLGLKAANISEWEAGKGNPSFQQSKRLFELGITVEELFGVEYNRVAVAKESDLDFKRRVALALRELAAELRV
jgi:transcriptional regulator with XRE-family HTH domain